VELRDLTGNNPGVVVETGIALALKPNTRIVLVTQDELEMLHFDMKGIYFGRYEPQDLVDSTARGLVQAACEFDDEALQYVKNASASLISDAILLLNRYGSLWQNQGVQLCMKE
jgi:hypothetical protein